MSVTLDSSVIDTIKQITQILAASLFGGGAAAGGIKYMDGKKQAEAQAQASVCSEHHKLFEELKEDIAQVKEDVAYMRGKMDAR